MSRCTICGKSGAGTSSFFDKRFSVREDGMVYPCGNCFNLWATNNDPELMKVLERKLLPDASELNETVRQLKERSDNNENT